MSGRIQEQIGENPKRRTLRVFTCSRILTNFAKVLTGYGGMDNVMLDFFYKIIIFSLNKKKDDIKLYEVHTGNSQNL